MSLLLSSFETKVRQFNEIYSAVFFFGAVYYAVQVASNF